jgi:branched-chain amino acid transport system permease protein
MLRIFALLGLLLGLLALPQWMTQNSLLNNLADMLLFLALVSSWNFFSGATGHFDLGHTVYFGLGAYIVAILNLDLAIPFALAVLIASVLSASMALLVGRFLLSLRGAFFSIASLVLLIGSRNFALAAGSLTGGGRGLVLSLDYQASDYYYAAFGFLIVLCMAIYMLQKSELKLMLSAIRQDETAAALRGIPVIQLQLFIYVLASLSVATVGGVWLYRHSAIDPSAVFSESQSFALLIAAFVGGINRIEGSLIGGLLFYLTLGQFPEEWRFILGAALLILMLARFPNGILSFWRQNDAANA